MIAATVRRGALCTARTFVGMDAAIAPEHRYYSEEEWVALEEELDTKFEYLDGHLYDVRAMAGGTTPHNRASSNAGNYLRDLARAQGRKCFAYTSDMKVQVVAHRRYYYPDTSIRCGDEEPGGKVGSYRNPTIVVEVVSESSYHRDTVTKFAHYATLPSLRDYVLVFLKEPVVQVYSRRNHSEDMTARTYFGLDAQVYIPSLGGELAMADLYEEVEFPPQAKVVRHPSANPDDGHE